MLTTVILLPSRSELKQHRLSFLRGSEIVQSEEKDGGRGRGEAGLLRMLFLKESKKWRIQNRRKSVIRANSAFISQRSCNHERHITAECEGREKRGQTVSDVHRGLKESDRVKKRGRTERAERRKGDSTDFNIKCWS